MSVNSCAAIEPLKDKEVHKSVFTPEQVTAILKAVEDLEFSAPRGGKLAKGENEKLRRDWQGLVLTAFYTGGRLGDCANLQWKHVDLVSEIKTIRFNQGKTGAEIVVVVHPVLEDHLLKLPTAKSDDDFIFPSLAQRKISPLSKQFRKIIVSSIRLAPNSATLPKIPTMLFFRSLICTASRRSTARTVSLVT